jgi:hypothetical protein
MGRQAAEVNAAAPAVSDAMNSRRDSPHLPCSAFFLLQPVSFISGNVGFFVKNPSLHLNTFSQFSVKKYLQLKVYHGPVIVSRGPLFFLLLLFGQHSGQKLYTNFNLELVILIITGIGDQIHDSFTNTELGGTNRVGCDKPNGSLLKLF